MLDKTQTQRSRTATFGTTRSRSATVTRYATDRSALSAGVNAAKRGVMAAARALRSAWVFVTEVVSSAGWLAVMLAVTGITFALWRGWAEGLVVAAGCAMLIILAVPFLIGRQQYTVTLVLDADRVVAGTTVTARLDVTNDSSRVALPAVLDIPLGQGLVEAYVPLLRGKTSHNESLTITAAKRGILTVGPLTVGRADPLGLLRKDHTWPGVHTIYVHPVTAAVPSLSAGVVRDLEGAGTKRIVDEDLNFHAIRDYVAGDSRRHIHWKSTAKTGALMVRQYEETKRSRIAVVVDLDSSSYADSDSFEMAMSAAASLSVQAIREGRDVLVTTSARIPETAKGSMHAVTSLPTATARAVLDAFSAVNASDEVMSLEHVAAMTAAESAELSLVFIVTGQNPEPARLRRCAVAFAADVAITVVRCEPIAQPQHRALREAKVLTIGALHDLGHLLLRTSA